jgi:hypothetical protein
MIAITQADEVLEVKTICMTVYSNPGLGKTSLAFTAKRPLLLDFDKGAYRAVDRGASVQIEKWADVAEIRATDLKDFDTIVIDTVGKALDFLTADIVEKNSKHAYGGALNQQGWGQLGVRFGAFLRLLKGFGKDVILLSHMEEKSDGDQVKERLKISGGTNALVLTDSDRISIYNKERHLVFSPTETAFGKDPANLVDLLLPDASSPEFKTFLGDTIQQVKDGLNQLSEAQVERKSEVEWFTSQLPDMLTAEDINAVLGRAKKAGRDIAQMVVKRAAELGLEYDSETQGYLYLEEMTDEETPIDEAA